MLFQMKPILILLSPAFGHYHATYKIATQLKERGYSVIYAGESTYNASVTAHGFGFREFSFSDLVRDRYAKARYFQLSLIPYFFSNLFNKSSRKMYRNYVAAIMQAKDIIAEIDPALILLDIHISTLYLLLVQTGIPCFQICTTLSTSRARLVPPINSGFIPKKTVTSTCFAALLWTKHLLQSKMDYFFQKAIYAGKDNDSFLRKFAKENGIRPTEFAKNKTLRTSQIPVLELIFAPELFEYPWHTRLSNVFHIGPSVLLEREEICDETMSELLEKLKYMKVGGGASKIVYCSLGTINYWQNKNCLHFFKKVIDAFGKKSDWFMIMMIGNDISRKDLGDIPDNVKVFKVVPQIKVLSVCDVMITHGGFNTVKESILSGIPMVVYPLSNLWDQEGNAARVVYHKIGLRGKLEKDSSQKIFAKVDRLFQDPDFKKNISAMRVSFEQLNNSTTGVDKIDSFLKGKVKFF